MFNSCLAIVNHDKSDVLPKLNLWYILDRHSMID